MISFALIKRCTMNDFFKSWLIFRFAPVFYHTQETRNYWEFYTYSNLLDISKYDFHHNEFFFKIFSQNCTLCNSQLSIAAFYAVWEYAKALFVYTLYIYLRVAGCHGGPSGVAPYVPGHTETWGTFQLVTHF